jgi:hypothetical protein
MFVPVFGGSLERVVLDQRVAMFLVSPLFAGIDAIWDRGSVFCRSLPSLL